MPEQFDGATFETAQDAERLTGQLARVRALMADGRWRTLALIALEVSGSEAGVSARLRDLRKPRFGGSQVERRRVGGGLFEYRVVPAPAPPLIQECLFTPPTHCPERLR